MLSVREEEIEHAVAALDAWFETMRSPHGYGGPVVHWWQDCLHFTGSGLDWRYEGIILGYLTLWNRTSNEHWLKKAQRAGDDLLRGQLPNGNFRRSSFEANPASGGTPHEAACDLALLQLAKVSKGRNDPNWQAYLAAAERNLQNFILDVLWDKSQRRFCNTAFDRTFVPNKAATIAEALFAWTTLTGNSTILEEYTLPTLNEILDCQVQAASKWLDGAVAQSVHGNRLNPRFFPFYIARCIPALVQGYHIFGDRRYLRAARAAMNFILRCRLPDGSFPQVVYSNGRMNRYPQWIAGVGDILRAMVILLEEGMEIEIENSLRWLINGFEAPGRLRTAYGFASQVSQRAPARLPEFRDLLPVCGWTDKAFRFLASMVRPGWRPLPGDWEDVELECIYRQRRMKFLETTSLIELKQDKIVHYRWYKGQDWTEAAW